MRNTTEQAELGDFQLGRFQVFPSQSLLRQTSEKSADVDIHLEPKVMAVLERLAKDAQRVVSRQSLLDDVWAGTVVTEEVVTRCISELRTALGDNSRAPLFIQTIPKKGYKLLQLAEPLEPPPHLAPPSHPPQEHTSAESNPTDPVTAKSSVEIDAPETSAEQSHRPPLYWALVASVIIAAGALGMAGTLFMQDRTLPPEVALQKEELAAPEATPSIAILPFATLDSGAESNYFGAGLAEELLNALANVPGLRVISRHAAADADQRADARADARNAGDQISPNGPSQSNPVTSSDISAIGRTLGVDNVLKGSVRRMNNNVRVTAQLVSASDGVLLWADQFEGDLSDVFRIQDDIAAAIVGALRLKLTEPVRVARISDDMDALDYYLLGRHHWHQRTSESLRRAIELFKRAAQIDSDMAIAYSGLADAYLLLADYGNMTSEEAEALARPAIDTALQLDNTLAEAHASQGMLYLSTGETELAERALRNAVRLNPGYHMAHMWLGSTIAMHGQVREAHKHYLKAYRLDPLHPVINQNIAMSFATIGDYDASSAILGKLDARFDNRKRLHYMKISLAQQLGNFSELRELAEAALADTDPKLKMAAFHALWLMHSRLGQHDAAEEYLAQASAAAELNYEFRLNLARKLAREGAAKEFNALMQEAPDHFHEKASLEERSLEGILLIATENYAKAAKVLEAALTVTETMTDKKRHPASELLSISHLLYVYDQLENTERKAYWFNRGNKVIAKATEAGYGQMEFITESGFFHAAAGQAEAASKAFWQALTIGKIAPWEITDDIRTSTILRSDEIKPIVQQAALSWTA